MIFKHYYYKRFNLFGFTIDVTFCSKKLNAAVNAIMTETNSKDFESANLLYIDAIRKYGMVQPVIDTGKIIRWEKFKNHRKK